ncbi:MAG: anthranilate synthase component I [Verrucomicrobiota bacterium]
MLKPSLDDFLALTEEANMVPIWTEITADYETPLSVFHKIHDGRYCALLESAESTDGGGRYSIVSAEPREILSCQRGRVTIERPRKGETEEREMDGDPLTELEALMSRFRPAKPEGLPPFFGGAIGYLAYDVVRSFEPTIQAPPPDALHVPDSVFLICDSVVVYDHLLKKIQIIRNVFLEEFETPEAAYASAEKEIERIGDQLDDPVGFAPFHSLLEAPPLKRHSNTTQSEYEEMVEKAKEYIRAGDIFQVVPSQRFSVPYDGGAVTLYRALRSVNPSPYMFCLEFPDEFALVGSSPEVHVKCIDGEVAIRPIAGTRWRGKSPAEDDALAEELLADPKERAEHIMLVDLARNDVGRISNYGEVTVDDLMIIERYSHVMHIVSNVSGTLAEGRSSYDVMRATFPAGTVSGSPKVRAMQIINELEKNKRGAYSGAVGYFGFDGNLDSCIALRTCVLRNGQAYVQAGAGVVADSVPTSEYQETVNKAMALIRAIEKATALEQEIRRRGL